MSIWLNRVKQDLGAIIDLVDFYDSELLVAQGETKLYGSIEKQSSALPGIVSYRFLQLQELESVLEYLNIEYRRLRAGVFKKFLESYNRALSSRDAEKYVDGDASVVDMAILINDVALIRNKYLAIHKGLEAKQWQIGHITKLRCAGIEDASV